VFKLFRGIEKLDYEKFFKLNGNSTLRGHNCKIYKQRSRTELRRHSFSLRVVDSWNKLPKDVVNAETLNILKNKLDDWFLKTKK